MHKPPFIMVTLARSGSPIGTPDTVSRFVSRLPTRCSHPGLETAYNLRTKFESA